MRSFQIAALSTLLLLAAGTQAHDGHGTTAGDTIQHYASEPLHLIGIVSAVVGVALLAVALWRMRRRQR